MNNFPVLFVYFGDDIYFVLVTLILSNVVILSAENFVFCSECQTSLGKHLSKPKTCRRICLRKVYTFSMHHHWNAPM